MPSQDDLKKTTMKISDLEHKPSPTFVEVYSSNVNAGASFQDLRLIFGQILIGTDEPHIEDRAAVTMSWEHTKALRDLLNRLLEEYEVETGPIRAQPSS